MHRRATMDRAVKQSAVRELTRDVDVTRTNLHDRRPRSLDRVVITGGAGFLGSHVCTELVSRGTQVVCLDNTRASSGSSTRTVLPSGHARPLAHHGAPRPRWVGARRRRQLGPDGRSVACARMEAPL